MGFADLFRGWKGEGILARTLDDFVKMLDDGHWMYQKAATALWQETDVERHKREIRDRDIQINQAERTIRKKIVEHLAINPGKDANYCLILMSVVKDAERLGDYCKNLVEVSEYYATHKDENELVTAFKDLQVEVEGMFRQTGKAFRDSDEKLGQMLVQTQQTVQTGCDKLIERILEAKDLNVRQAVCYTLLARYYKRIAAHLGNIASSLVMPIHKLDYYDEDYLPKGDA